jgi:hypothetical protein
MDEHFAASLSIFFKKGTNSVDIHYSASSSQYDSAACFNLNQFFFRHVNLRNIYTIEIFKTNRQPENI